MSNIDESKALNFVDEGSSEIMQLIQEHKYNISMIKSRQLLEYMIRCLSDKFEIEGDNISRLIEELLQNKIITEGSAENYQRIFMLSNSAIHNNDNNSYNARTSIDLLREEVEIFADILNTVTKKTAPIRIERNSAMGNSTMGDSTTFHSNMENSRSNRNKVNTDDNSTKSSEEGVAMLDPSSIAAKINRSRNKSAKKRRTINMARLALTFAIPVVVIIVIIGLFVFVRNTFTKGSSKKATTTVAVTTTAVVETTTTQAETTAASKVYVTTSALNVRSAPSTDGEKIATLPAGTTIEYVEAYDNNWAVINYNNARAYVASQYIKVKE